MSDLPIGWQETEIENLFHLINGRAFKPAERSPSGLPIIRIQNLNNPSKDFNFYDGEFSDRHLVNYGDLLFAWSGTPGTSFGAHTWKGEKALLNQHIFKMPPILPKSTNIAFFKNAINRKLVELIGSAQGGVGLRHVTKGVFSKTKIVVPPLNEQKRIVDKLESCESRITAARGALDEVPALLEQYRQSILAAAFRGGLTKDWRTANPDTKPISSTLKTVSFEQSKSGRAPSSEIINGKAAIAVGRAPRKSPNGWKWVPLLQVARMESGHTPSKSRSDWWNGTIPWIGIKDARKNNGSEIHSTLQHTNKEGLANSAARLLPTDTVCLSRTASVGYVVKMGKPMATSQDFANWICSEALLPDYLMFALLAEGDHLKKFGRGSTHTTIYFPELKSFQICLPPISEQVKIISLVKRALEKIENLQISSENNRNEIDALVSSLLSKAFSGQLVPQDASDEPASILLDRIKEKRFLEEQIRKKRPKKKRSSNSPMSKAIPATIQQALEDEDTKLSTSDLFAKMGHANDSSSGTVESFLIQLRDALDAGTISKTRKDDEDYFSLKTA